MKKLLALLLCLVMVFSLAACAAKEEATSDTPTPAQTEEKDTPKTEPAGEPAEAERPTLTIGVMQNPNTVDYETNDFTRYLEDSLNVNLDFVFFSGTDINDAATQLALMISGGETLPDILWGFDGLDLNVVHEYGEDGYLLDISDYFTEETAPNVMAQIQNAPEQDRDKILQYGRDPSNGALYAFPYYADPGIDNCSAHVEVNTAFLEALGMSTPTTVDEVYDYLKAVVENDPNGNGVADEIGAIGYSGYCADLVQFIINAYVYCNDKYFFNATDGQIWAPYNTDEYRQALIYVNQLVKDGLLNTMTFTIPESGGESEIIPYITPSDQVAITGLIGGHLMLVSESENPVILDYEPIVPLKAETDKGGYAAYNASTLTYVTMITTDCENPDLAFKLLDFLSHPDSIRRMRYGTEGQGWEAVTEGTSAYGNPANVRVLDSSVWSTQNNQTWHTMGAVISTSGNLSNLFEVDDSWASRRNVNCYAVMNAYEQAPVPAEVVGDLVYTAEESEVVAEVSQILKDYVKEARALFATGAMDPNSDADWQRYLDALEGQGLSSYIEAAQAAYTRMTAN